MVTLSMMPKGKRFLECGVSGFSKFQGPSGSDVRLICGWSNTTDLITTFRCSNAQKSRTVSVVLDQPQINLTSDPDGPWNFENPETPNSKNLFPLGIIDKVTINHGQLIASILL